MDRLVLKYFVLSLFLSFIMFASSLQARQLNVLKNGCNCDERNVICQFTNNLDLGAIKRS
ncbi:hypothetical protein MKX01_007426 [Papaver californicum]|nr:hypothetical protein MKX01_007426 [Papaver californicum]